MTKAKPILFNTNMVKAILDGRKTITRRVVKNMPYKDDLKAYKTPSGLMIGVALGCGTELINGLIALFGTAEQAAEVWNRRVENE